MQMGRIAVVGDGGLLGEIMAGELARHGEVLEFTDCDALLDSGDPKTDAIGVWADAKDIGEIRQRLRQQLPANANPLLIFMSQADPYIYFTQLRAIHVDRRRLGFNAMFDEIAGRIAAGHTTNAPARAGSV